MKVAPPFPYFGGKSAVASTVWQRFGDVRNYVEPFAGSCAVLLRRPHWPFAETRTETVNDLNCYLSNFWRALQHAPDDVARWCDWPVNEADLHARHLWLVKSAECAEFRERMRTDPDYFDAKIAGWWCWGACCWIGSGWCDEKLWADGRPWQKRPHLGNAGRGVSRPSQKLPHLGDAGRGVNRPSQQLPHLGSAGQGDLYEYLGAIAERLRGVRVCCGDWQRVCGPTPTVKQGLTGVFLDPPYAAEANRKDGLYATDDLTVAHTVREWCLAQGDDPRMRIALCGYEGEHEMPESWECFAWKASGGYGSRSGGNGLANSHRERIWFSPHCLKAEQKPRQLSLLEEST